MGRADPPFLPKASIRGRIAELGYGSGPWARADLEGRWGEAVANKVIAEAKPVGWLVAPSRDHYFVPAAADLMTVAWLPEARRREFIISRTLAAANLRFWSLSAWAATEGLLFSEPLFVVDLSFADPPSAPDALEPDAPAPALSRRARERAEAVRSIPFLENVIIVPVLGKLGNRLEPSRVRLPEPPSAGKRASAFAAGETAPNVIEYHVTRRMDDAAWILAFLTALDLPRTRGELRRLAEEEVAGASRKARGRSVSDLMDRAARWSSCFGPPRPNDDWRSVLAGGAAPYLLVPPSAWEETLSLTSSRMFEQMRKLRRSLDA